MAERDHFRPDWASPPGETIADLLEARRLSPDTLGTRLGKPEQYIHDLLSGRASLTADVADQLEMCIGMPARFWLSREAQYRDSLTALQPNGPTMSADEFLRTIPIGEMQKLGWLQPSRSKAELVDAALRFFDVSNIGVWQTRYFDTKAVAAFRTSATFESEPGAVSAWLRRGEIEAASLHCEPWDSQVFRDVLALVRQLTRIKEPAEFLPKLVRNCVQAGVAVVVAKAPGKCRASGATRFLSSKKALLLLSFRHLSDDHFWFSFFHEAGHLLLHDNDLVFIDGADDMSADKEQEANDFAARELIPEEFHPQMFRLTANGRDVIRFARTVGISPGIVVGQLQHLGRLRHNQLNNLKRRYQWTGPNP